MAQYDLLLRGGRVIDPARGVDGELDVAVRGDRIATVAARIDGSAAATVVDVTGQLVLPGLVDTHAHVYRYVTGRFGLDADMVGIHSGITALADQGGASCMTFPGFRKFVVEPAATRVYAFLSAYLAGGLEGHYYPALYRPIASTSKPRSARPGRIET
jgi:dihydroorotase